MAWGLARISSREISEWKIYDQHEPIGGNRLDLHMARIMAMLATVYRDQTEHPEPFGPDEFLIDWWSDQPGRARSSLVQVDELTIGEQVTWLAVLNATFGGVDKRQNGDNR